jgi:GntR family transcriptional regulator, rspAB operon transcriptional repressor
LRSHLSDPGEDEAVDGARATLPRLVITGLDAADRPQIKDLVYQRLVEAVVSHELPPGTHLKERDLEVSLGVSKTPIREALVRMEKERLVDISPYRGAVVRTLTKADLREVYDLRELLEGFCARRAAMVFTEEQEQKLRRNLRASREAVAADSDTVPALLEEFDHILHEAAAGHRVGALLIDLEFQLQLFGRLASEAPGRPESSIEEHASILHAIVTRDPDGAEKLCRRHIRSVYADLMDQLSLED